MVCEIEHEMPARELVEWIEYETLEPFGAWRDNWHAAVIASILANVNRKPGTPPVSMADFFYTDPATAQEQKEAAMIAFIEGKVDG